jgi:hypothetical protein
MKTVLMALAITADVVSMSTAYAMPIEPRSLTWNIVSDRDMTASAATTAYARTARAWRRGTRSSGCA